MPLPTKREGEGEKEFISRCMSDPVMREEFPRQDQRFKVCQSRARKTMSNFQLAFADILEPIECGIVGKGQGGTVLVDTPIAKAYEGRLQNGPQKFKLTTDMLDEMVANYQAWLDEGGAPAAGYFGHPTSLEEARARAAAKEDPAFHIIKVWRVDSVLWGRLEFQPAAWSRVNGSGTRTHRGLSIVFREKGKGIDGKPIGATLHGVDVVPDPFLPVQIAASRNVETDEVFLSMASRWALADDTINDQNEEEDAMSDKLIANLETKIQELSAKVEEQTATLKQLQSDNEALQKKAEDSAAEATKLKKEMAASESAKAGAEAKEAIELALERGVILKADVVGYEESPEKALAAFEKLDMFTSPSALLRFCSKAELPTKVTMNKRVNSGRPKGDTQELSNESEDDAAQAVFLSKVDEVHSEARKLNKDASYRESMLQATRQFPEEYKAYLAATGRSV